ncbi:hypothetical protein DMENIID0001_022910 [Sergentomyia squamirostris]
MSKATSRTTRASPADCHVCKKRILAKTAPGFVCGGTCGLWYHGCCTSPPVSAEQMKGKGFYWLCSSCYVDDDSNGDQNGTHTLSGEHASVRDDVAELMNRCRRLEQENGQLRELIESLVSRVSALEARPTGPFHSSPRPSMRGRSFNCDSNILNESPPPGFDLGASGVNRPRIPPPPAENGCQEEPAVRRHLALPSGPHVQPNSDIPERLAIVGRAKRADGPGLLRVVPKFKWLFVTRLSREVTSEQLAEFLAQNLSSKRSPQCFSLIPRGDTTRRVASFKVALMPDEFHEAMSEEFWDLGIFVSEFTFRPFRWGRGGPLLPDRGQGLDEGERGGENHQHSQHGAELPEDVQKPGESSSPAAEDDARAIGNSAGPGGDGGSNAGES